MNTNLKNPRGLMFGTLVAAALLLGGISSAAATRMCVLPFASVSLQDADVLVIAEALRQKLDSDSIEMIDGFGFMDAMIEDGCGAGGARNRESCILKMGQRYDADIVCAGSLDIVGTLVDCNIALYDVKERAPVWTNRYRIAGGVENFYLKAVPKITDDIRIRLKKTTESAPLEPVESIEEETGRPEETISPPETKREPEETGPSPAGEKKELDNGIVTGPTIGLTGRIAMGDERDMQTPFTLTGRFLMPTFKNAQLRAQAGIPLYHNDNLELSARGKYPDASASMEHEWGFRRVGIGAGLSYMYMQAFTLNPVVERINYYYGEDTTINRYRCDFETDHAVNMVLNFRGGKPTGGIFARLSVPLFYTENDGEPDNYFVEYSVFGAFGSSRIKAGIGIAMMTKVRTANAITDFQIDTTFEYYDRKYGSGYYEWDDNGGYYDYRYDEIRTTKEFYLLLPCLKVAARITDHIVAGVTFELGGTLLPRQIMPFQDNSSYEGWKPMIGADVVYSFGKLKSPNLYDGTF